MFTNTLCFSLLGRNEQEKNIANTNKSNKLNSMYIINTKSYGLLMQFWNKLVRFRKAFYVILLALVEIPFKPYN